MLRAATTVTIRVGLGVMVRVRVAVGLGWGKLGLVNGLGLGMVGMELGLGHGVEENYKNEKITWLLRAATAAAGIVAGEGGRGWLGLR